jgi:hypothetical protein
MPKISALPASAGAAGTDIFPTVKAGVTQKTTIDQVIAFLAASGINFTVSVTWAATKISVNPDGSLAWANGASSLVSDGSISINGAQLLLNADGSASFSGGVNITLAGNITGAGCSLNADGSATFANTIVQIGTAGELGFFSQAPAAQQTVQVLTNNATSSGTQDQIDDFSDLIVYANDAQAIHNDIYQLAEKVKAIYAALSQYGLITV